MEIRIEASGLEGAERALRPEQVYTAMMLWYERGTRLVADELRSRAPARLRGKVYIRVDTLRPPRWARIGVKSGLARLIEGGTGALGDPSFRHVSRHWPSTEGITQTTGLPRPQAFLVARSIGLRGGNPPRPFIQPTWRAVAGRVEQLAEQVVAEVLAGGGL